MPVTNFPWLPIRFDVVPLERHHVGTAGVQGTLEIANAISQAIVRAVGKDLKHYGTRQCLAPHFDIREISVVGIDDIQLRIKNQDTDWCRVEQKAARPLCIGRPRCR